MTCMGGGLTKDGHSCPYATYVVMRSVAVERGSSCCFFLRTHQKVMPPPCLDTCPQQPEGFIDLWALISENKLSELGSSFAWLGLVSFSDSVPLRMSSTFGTGSHVVSKA